MVGTGFGDSSNTTAHYAASNNTYLVATVFGYSSALDEPMEYVAHNGVSSRIE